MRIVLAMAFAASLLVAAGCSCATGECGVPVADCAPCGAPAPVVTYKAPAPVVVAAPAPVAVAPAVCNPCAGL